MHADSNKLNAIKHILGVKGIVESYHSLLLCFALEWYELEQFNCIKRKGTVIHTCIVISLHTLSVT